MSLEASSLTVRVISEGITDATKALNDLAAAGEKAEKKTSNIGSGAKASAKAQVDAAQEAASAYNAIIDMMTEKSNTFYQNKAMQAALASQQELFEGMALADKLSAIIQQSQADRAAMREKESADIRAKQQQQMEAAQAWYAAQQEMANRMNAAFDKKQENAAKIQAMKQEEAEWKALAKAADEYYASEKKLAADADKFYANKAKAQASEDAKKLADAQRALRQETERLAAAEAAEQKENASRAQTAEAFINSLKRQAEATGLHGQKLRDYQAELTRTQAAQLGLMKAGSDSEKQINSYINTIRNTKGPHESFNLLTAGSARELMVLGHELSQGQFQRFGGSLIVLGERINFLPSLLEKGASAANSLGMSFGLFATGVTAVIAVIAALGVAFYKGASEQKHFNNALILTGNYAGVTGDSLNKMAVDIGRSAGSIGDAKKVVLQLAESGRFTAEQIAFIAPAITEVAHVTGKSTDDMVHQFENMATLAVTSTKRSTDQISQHVLKLNDQYHFLTASQFEQISMLEKQGEAQEAINMAEEAYARKLKERAEEIKGNLGTIQTIWMDIKEAAGSAWDAMLGIGKKATASDTIERLKGILETMDSRPAWFSGRDQGGGAQKQFDESRMRIVQALTAAVIEKNKADAEAINKGKEQQEQTAGMHAIARTMAVERQVSKESALAQALAEQKVNDELAKQAIAHNKLSEDANVRAAAEQAEARFTDEAIAKRNKLITDYYSKKQPKPHTEGLSGLDADLNALNNTYEVQKRVMDNRIKLIDYTNKFGLKSDEEAQVEKESILDAELKLEEAHLEAAKKAIEAFHSNDIRLMKDAASKKENIEKQLGRVQSDIKLKQQMNDLVPDVNAALEQVKQQKEQDNILKQIEKQTATVDAQVEAYNRLPDAVKAAGVHQKEMASEVEQSLIDSLEAEKANLLDMDAMYTIVNQRRINQIDEQIAARKKLQASEQAKEKNDKQNNAALGRSSALTKIATEQTRMWKDIGSEIEKSLTTAFGNSGAAAGKMFKAFAEGQADAISLTDKARVIGENKSLSEIEKSKQLKDINIQRAQNEVGMYGGMADAASMFFEKGSTGYQAMTKAAQVLHTAEVALSVIKGVNAILTQGSGDPYSAFARMAAMAAIVAGLGVAISGSFGGGGGSFSSADQQKIQGTGTVLGSPTITDGTKVVLVGEKSNSIANSLKIAEKNSGLGLVVQNDMLTALQQLNNNISNFAAEIVKSTNISNPSVNLNTNNGAATNFALGIISMVAGPIGTLVAKMPVLNNVVGKIATSVFGGKQSLDDSGFTITKTSLGNVMANGIDAKSYANITTSGGWFRSDKHNTQLSSLGADTNDQFAKVILSMSDTLKVAAKGLGMDSDAFNNKLKNFVIDVGNVSFKGMTGDEIQKTLQNVFSKLGDQMAQYAFSDLQKYQRVGEGLMETVVRIANDLMQVNDVFKVLGRTIPTAAAGIAQAEKLVESFGSSDALTKAVKTYEDSIYTDSEKLVPVIKSVQDSLASMGLSSIKTKEDFKLVVDSLDLTSDSGVALFNKLMTLAPTFGTAIDGIAKTNENTKNSIQSVIDKLKQFSDNIRKFRDGLVLSTSSPLTPQQQLAAAASQFETTIKKAMAGDATAQGNVTDIAQSYLDAARTMYASGDAYTAVFQKVEDELAKVQDFADNGVSDAQKQLDTMTDQLTSLNTLNGTATDILNSLNNLVSGTSPATTATSSTSTNNELLAALNQLVGTVQKSDENNSAALNNVAAANYDGQQAAASTISEGINAAVSLLKKSGKLYEVVDR
jgi:phage-related minor tail protein